MPRGDTTNSIQFDSYPWLLITCIHAEQPGGGGCLQCALVRGRNSVSQNPPDLLDANTTPDGGGWALGAFHLRVIARTVIHFHSGCCALHFILQIRVGNVYPMTLAMFQSLLNASYSYFTMLRGVTGKWAERPKKPEYPLPYSPCSFIFLFLFPFPFPIRFSSNPGNAKSCCWLWSWLLVWHLHMLVVWKDLIGLLARSRHPGSWILACK